MTNDDPYDSGSGGGGGGGCRPSKRIAGPGSVNSLVKGNASLSRLIRIIIEDVRVKNTGPVGSLGKKFPTGRDFP